MNHGQTNSWHNELFLKTDPQHKAVEWVNYSGRIAIKVAKILDRFQPIPLKEMKAVELLDRTDTKFVFHVQTLYHALPNLVASYRVLEISNRRLHSYQNLYFDTPQMDMFVQHHRQQRDRYKVRCRAYTDTNTTFLEVKRKTNRDRTIKKRLETTQFIDELPLDYGAFLQEYYPNDPNHLKPVLWNEFHRITLVNPSGIERLTLDINLGFSNGWNRLGLPGVVVAEVKQKNFTIHSTFMTQMRELGIQPRRFSKYCMGIPQFYPHIKANRFKPRQILVENIIDQGATHGSYQ